jgi:hypothetical protein
MSKVEDYALILRNLRERGIFFSVNLVFGLDSDTSETLTETVTFLRREKVPMSFMYQPRGFSPAELETAFWHACAQLYSPGSIIQRLIPSSLDRKTWLISLASNLHFVWSVRRHRIPVNCY